MWRKSKWGRRLQLIGINSANSVLLPIFNTAVSVLVVRLASAELWGEFVTVMLVVQLGTHFIAWGNRDFLLRAFSREPARIAAAWQSSLLTRAALFVPLVLIVGAAGWPFTRVLAALIWSAAFVVYQSHEVVIVYRRAFGFSIVLESLGFGALLGAIVGLRQALTVDHLIALFAAMYVAKAAALVWHFRSTTLSDKAPVKSRVTARYYGQALPFMLVGLAGLIHSRIDLYSVSLLLSPSDVGHYEIFSGLLLYFQALASFVLLPFVKSLYRLDYPAIRRIARRLFAVGALLVGPFLIAAAGLLHVIYRFDFAPLFYLFGGLYVLPMYWYAPIIYALYKANRQSTVLTVNLAGIGLKLALNLLLLPRLGLLGAVVSVGVVQWLILAAYEWRGRRLLREANPALAVETV
jgi:O-antigen/teichoic acid export membrane protein